MAISYKNDNSTTITWDGGATQTPITSSTNVEITPLSGTTITISVGYRYTPGGRTPTTDYPMVFIPPAPRKMFVENSPFWDDATVLQFVSLVNLKLSCGWRIDALIKGDVVIIDPNIEIRTMQDFMPLIYAGCGEVETGLLSEFLSAHPIFE